MERIRCFLKPQQSWLLRLRYLRLPLPFVCRVGKLCNDCCSLFHTQTHSRGWSRAMRQSLSKQASKTIPLKNVLSSWHLLSRGKKKEREWKQTARLTSPLKEVAHLVASSLTVTAPTLGVCGSHGRDHPAPGELPNDQAVGSSWWCCNPSCWCLSALCNILKYSTQNENDSVRGKLKPQSPF